MQRTASLLHEKKPGRMASKESEEETKANAIYACNRWTGRAESGEAGGRKVAALVTAEQILLLAQQVLKKAAGDSEWYRNFIAWILDRPFLAGSGPNLLSINLRQARVFLNEVRRFFHSSPAALLLPLKPLLAAASADEVQSLRGKLFHFLREGRTRYSGSNQLQQGASLDAVCWNEVQDLGRLDWPSVVPPRPFSSRTSGKILCGLLHTLAVGYKICTGMPWRISALSRDLTVSVIGRRLRAVRNRSARSGMKGATERTLRLLETDIPNVLYQLEHTLRLLEMEIPNILYQLEAPGTLPDGDSPEGWTDYGIRKQQNCLKVGDACSESHVSDHKSAMVCGEVEMKLDTSDVLHGSACMASHGAVQDSPAAIISKKRPYGAMARGILMGPREKLRRAARGTWMTTKRLRGGDAVRSAWSAKKVGHLCESAVKCEKSEKVSCEVGETVPSEGVCSKPEQSVANHSLDCETPVGWLGSGMVTDVVHVEGGVAVGDDEHDDMHIVNVCATVLSNLRRTVVLPVTAVASSSSCPRNGKKRKNQAIEEIPDSKLNSTLDELGKQCRAKKKVRFCLRSNTLWTPPSCPLPPLSMRTPPSARPRGSALKKGVLPGPICEEPVVCKKRLSSRSTRRSSSDKSPKTIGRSAKESNAHRSPR